VKYDDETLMAFADGELDEVRRAAITAAMENDPELAQRVARHRALRAQVAGAFGKLLDEPAPERLVHAARGAREPAKNTRRGGDVVQFPVRGSRLQPMRWRAREWGAIAASLVLGGLISWTLLAPSAPMMTASGSSLVARGALASALDRQLASTQLESDPVWIGLSFQTRDGHICRSFELRAAGTAGLGCKVDGEWRIPVTSEVPARSGGVRQAASPPPAVLQVIEARISGDPLDPAAEEKARDVGWNAARR
jgi:hypothetical protein